jgi:hypothetical protein
MDVLTAGNSTYRRPRKILVPLPFAHIHCSLQQSIAALEGRKVVTVDIPGAFMQTDIDELILVKLEDELVDVLLMVDNKYAEFVTHENGRKVFYVERQKALYGTLQASLLFWKELSNFLVKELAVEFNPYDKCVVSKMVNKHVVNQEVLEHIVSKLSKKFGNEDPLSVHRGDVHDHLGMTLDFSSKGKVVFRMVGDIENMFDELPTVLTGPQQHQRCQICSRHANPL